MDVDIRTTEPQTVAFVRMRGPYSQIPDAIKAVYMWAGMARLQPTGEPSAVYHTPPGETDEAQAEWEIYAPVAHEPEPRGPDERGFGVRRLEPTLMAATMHKGPYETIDRTYYALQAWIAENGYRMAGPPEESYLSDPSDTAPEDYLTEVRFPVVKG